VTVDAKQRFVVGSGKSRRTFARDAMTMLLDRKRALVYWNGTPGTVARGLSALIEQQVDKQFLAIAKISLETNDVPVIRRYLAEARVRGATKSEISLIERNLRRIATLNHRIRPSKVAALKNGDAIDESSRFAPGDHE